MADLVAHRGPDDNGEIEVRGPGSVAAILASRRLSIIDIQGGHQPLGNEDGSVQVVLNGEIDNFHEVRRELEARGHRFRTWTDTEVLVHLYEDEGVDLVHRLRGMFAFVLWQSRVGRLVLARDRLGVEPLVLRAPNRGRCRVGIRI